MPTSFSQTDICNRALQILGASAIVRIDENTKNARQCKVAYDTLRLALLRNHPWNFATLFADLPQVANPTNPPPAPQGTTNLNVFELPSGFVRLVAVQTIDTSGWLYDGINYFQNTDYYLQNNEIITWVQAPLHIRYVWDFENVNRMDPLFREALSYSMAHAMCEAITQSTSKKQTISNDLQAVLARAANANAFDKPPQDAPEDTYLSVRH